MFIVCHTVLLTEDGGRYLNKEQFDMLECFILCLVTVSNLKEKKKI